MKKFLFFLLVAVLICCFSAALADGLSASWSNGKLTVSASLPSGGAVEIKGPNIPSGTALTYKNPSRTFDFPADNQYHTVTCNTRGSFPGFSGSASFFAGTATEAPATEAPATPVPATEAPATPVPATEVPATPEPTATPAPTAAPTAEPTAVPTAEPTAEPTAVPTVAPTEEPGPMTLRFVSFSDGKLTLQLSNLHAPWAEIWVNGVGTGSIARSNGTITVKANNVKAGSNTATAHSAEEDASVTFTIKVKTPVLSSVSATNAKTVSFSASNLNGTTEVWLDSTGTGKLISTDGSYTVNSSKPLEEGSVHTLILHDFSFGVNSNSVSFTVPHFHDWGDWEETDPAKCTEAGKETRECKKCHDTETREIKQLGHALTKTDKVDPTCTGTGTEAYWTCSRCKKLFSDADGKNEIAKPVEIAAAGHALTKTDKVDPTCTEPGAEAYWTCSVCKKLFSDAQGKNEIAKAVEIAAAGHKLTKTDKVEPTCTEKGTEAYWTCSVCKKLFNDAAGKNEIAKAVEIAATGHTLTKTDKVEPTCTEPGAEAYWTCSVCKKLFSDAAGKNEIKKPVEIAALKHDLVVEPRVEPTCTEPGMTAGEYCTRCDYKGLRVEIPALGHDIVVDAAVEPTCTKTGLTEGEHCTRCDYKVAQEAVKALGHEFVAIKETAEGTLYKCSRCGESYTLKNGETVIITGEYGPILYDADKVPVDYTAGADSNDSTILVIDAILTGREGKTTEIGLYLTEDLIQTFIGEGYTSVKYVNGTAVLVIRLADISASWFETAEKIARFVFITTPQDAQNVVLKVGGELANGEFVNGKNFTGLVLKGTKEILSVRQNGLYTVR